MLLCANLAVLAHWNERLIICKLACHTITCPFENSSYTFYWNYVDQRAHAQSYVHTDEPIIKRFSMIFPTFPFDSIQFDFNISIFPTFSNGSKIYTVKNRNSSKISFFLHCCCCAWFVCGIDWFCVVASWYFCAMCYFCHCSMSQSDLIFIVGNVCLFAIKPMQYFRDAGDRKSSIEFMKTIHMTIENVFYMQKYMVYSSTDTDKAVFFICCYSCAVFANLLYCSIQNDYSTQFFSFSQFNERTHIYTIH